MDFATTKQNGLLSDLAQNEGLDGAMMDALSEVIMNSCRCYCFS